MEIVQYNYFLAKNTIISTKMCTLKSLFFFLICQFIKMWKPLKIYKHICTRWELVRVPVHVFCQLNALKYWYNDLCCRITPLKYWYRDVRCKINALKYMHYVVCCQINALQYWHNDHNVKKRVTCCRVIREETEIMKKLFGIIYNGMSRN